MVSAEINTKNNINGVITATKYLLAKSSKAIPIKLKIEKGKNDLQKASTDMGLLLLSLR